MAPVPPYLYKFLSLTRYSYEAIALGKAWYSSPSNLNDPYDGQLPIGTDVKDGFEAFQLAAQMTEMETGWTGGTLPFDTHSSDFQAGFRRFAHDWIKRGPITDIHSMTEVVDHLLLWAHYADSHRGLALRYKVEGGPTPVDGEYIGIEPVVYVDCLPSLHVRDLIRDLSGTLHTRYVTKGKTWDYEKEWRAIATKADCLLALPGVVDQIIFGHRMPPSSKEALRRIVGTAVNYFEARPRDDSFAVDIVGA